MTSSTSPIVERSEVALLDHALRRLVASHTRMLLLAGGIDPDDVGCRVEHEAWGLRVAVVLPEPVPTSIEHALKVRVLDAVGALGQNMGRVSVAVEQDHESRASGSRVQGLT